VFTAGGRVLGLTAWANDISSAIDTVYVNVKKVSFEGMQYRSDIARRALEGAK
jgi:phosphoribosylamine-glycine ligase